MKRTLLMALLAATAIVGCGGGSDDNTTPNNPTTPTTPSTPDAAVAPRFDYAGVWMEHDERCEWSQSAGQYELDVDVITRVSEGVYQRSEVDRYFNNAQCSGTPARSVTTSVEYFYVVGQGQLADGTAVDLIQETAQLGGAVKERCVAFVQDGKLFDECNDVPRPYPTQIKRTEWDVRLPS